MIGGVVTPCRRHSLLIAGVVALVVALFVAIVGFPSVGRGPKPGQGRHGVGAPQAWEDPRARAIELTDDIFLRACKSGEPIRESLRADDARRRRPHHRQTCFEKRLLRQDGTGFL